MAWAKSGTFSFSDFFWLDLQSSSWISIDVVINPGPGPIVAAAECFDKFNVSSFGQTLNNKNCLRTQLWFNQNIRRSIQDLQ